jgi:hypothetical protein
MKITSIDIEFLVDGETFTVHINLKPNGETPSALLRRTGQGGADYVPNKTVVTNTRYDEVVKRPLNTGGIL